MFLPNLLFRPCMGSPTLDSPPNLPITALTSNNKSQMNLRWLKTVSSTLMGRHIHSLSLDATIMVSKNCPIIGEHIVIIFVTQ